jgi:purine-binding chemotaxis protein CheW
METDSLTHIVARAGDRFVGIPSEFVRKIVRTPPVIAIPSAPRHVRGMVRLGDRVMPLVDLRRHLALPTRLEEARDFAKILDAREQDHRRWLEELEMSVREYRPFTLQRDPTKCAFGRWYLATTPEHATLTFTSLWRAIDEPHRRIHAIADAVAEVVGQSDFKAARAIIERGKTRQLAALIDLFGQMRVVLRDESRELCLVFCRSSEWLALSIDEVVSIEALDERSTEPMPPWMANLGGKLFSHLTRRRNGDVVTVVEVGRLFETN